MIKIDDKELRNPVEQIKKNMDDIADLKGNIKAQTVYSYKGLIGGTSVTQVNRSSTNVPNDVNEGWLTDYTGKLFRITGGNTTTLLIDYYASIKGASGTDGTDGVSPVITIVPFEGGNQVQVTDVNGTQKFNVFNGTDGQDGQDGLTTAIYVNGQTYTQEDGTITLPDYTDTVIDEDIIPKAFNTYVLGDNTHSYKEVVANKFKSPNSYYEISGVNVSGHGHVTIKTTNGSGTDEAKLQLGNIALYTNKNIAPLSGSTVNLGQAANGFNNLYLDGNIITENNLSKGLSLPDTTDWEDNKTIATTDQIVTSYNDLTDKPTIPSVEANSASTPTATLNNIDIDGTVYSIPQGGGATYTAGTGIDITNDEISIDNTVALKSELFSGDYDDLTNKPTIPTKTSELTNDSGYITGIDSSDVITALGYTPGTSNFSGDYDDLTNKPNLSNFVTSEDLQTELQNYVESSDLATVATSGEYSDLIGTPTLSTVATTGDYDDLINKPTIPDVSNYVKRQEGSGTTYTAIDNNGANIVLQRYQNGTKKGEVNVNSDGVKLTGDIIRMNANYKPMVSLDGGTTSEYIALMSDLPSVSYPVTDVQVDGSSVLDGTVAKITMPTVPITEIQVNGSTVTPTSGVVDITVPTLPTLATVATTGDYDDLTNKPTIPDAVTANTGSTPSATLTDLQVGSTVYSIPQGGSIPTNMVTTDTTQTITGEKTFGNTIVLTPDNNPKIVTNITYLDTDYERPILKVSDEGLGYAGIQIGGPGVSHVNITSYLSVTDGISSVQLQANHGTTPSVGENSSVNFGSGQINITKRVSSSGYNSYGVAYPETAGTLALLSDIPVLPTLATVATSGDYDDLINKPDLTDYIQKSNTAGLVKNDGTIDTNTYLTTAPVTSVNGQTGAVSLTIPTNADYVDLSSNQTINGLKSFNGVSFNQSGELITLHNGSYVAGRLQYGASNLLGISNDGNIKLATHTALAPATYGLLVPDTSQYTADKTIATTDDVNAMVGEVIFNNSAGSDALTITLNSSLANYNYIDIQWINNDNVINSTRIYDPDGKRISLANLFSFNPGTPEYINKAALYDLSGTSIIQVCKVQGTIRNNAASGVDYKSNSTVDGLIKITKVIGYKQNSGSIIIPTTATSTVTPTGETLTFTYSDNTTATYTFLTAVSVSTTIS